LNPGGGGGGVAGGAEVENAIVRINGVVISGASFALIKLPMSYRRSTVIVIPNLLFT